MSRLTHPRTIEALRESVRSFKRILKSQRDQLAKMEPLVPLLEPHCNKIFFGTQMYCKIEGGMKADFSAAVTRFAATLGEPPEIRINPGEYIAEFPASNVHLFLAGADDCKLVEVEEVITQKVMRPHPECLAALKALEEIA